MKKFNKGFTLIEITLSIILFSIMIDGLMVCYAHLTYEYSAFKQLEQLKQNAAAVQDFITYYMRTADQIEIITDSIKSQEEGELKEGARRLKFIKCTFEVPNKKNPEEVEIKHCQIALDEILSAVEKQGAGKYKLVYAVIENNQSKNNNLISDLIEQIIVCEDKERQVVEFECRFKKRDEENERLQVTKYFTESLAYKS